MGWVVQAYEGDVHMTPDSDVEPHVLSGDCWCAPRWRSDLSTEMGNVWSHRDQLDRLELAR